MKKSAIGNHLTPYLLVVCVLLAGILALESRNLVQSQDGASPGTRPAVNHVARANYAVPVIAVFSEITERPLFREGRQPPPEPQKPAVAKAKLTPLRLHLEGVAITPEASIALVRDLSNNKILRLSKGMQHQGWEVTAITTDGATFQRGEQSEELALKTEQNTHRKR
jgi:general secretion pathway protein N